MKKIIIIFLICIPNLFANDFNVGIGLVVPLGASISSQNQTHNADADKNDGVLSGKKSAFEFGISITPGFYKGFNNFMGFSIALDFGYKREVFSYNETKLINSQYETVDTIYYFDTINIGLLPKFNVASFFIGIGGGVKLALNGTEKYSENAIQLKSMYIPYFKATLDYLFLFTDELALGIGLYAGYDFGPHIKDSRFSKNILSGFDIGGQISFYFVND